MEARFVYALVVVTVGGALMGVQLGYATTAIQFTRAISDCTHYSTLDSCNSVSAVCNWTITSTPLANSSAAGLCGYLDQTKPCFFSYNETQCDSLDRCRFVDDECIHEPPWAPRTEGSFAAGTYLGSAIGSLSAGFLLQHFSHRTVLRVAGILSIIAVVFLAVGWNTPSPSTHQISSITWLLIGRAISGVCNGTTMVAAPLFGALLTTGSTARRRDHVIFMHHVGDTVAVFATACTSYWIDKLTPYSSQQLVFNLLHVMLCAVAVAQVIISLSPPPEPAAAFVDTAMTPLIKPDASETRIRITDENNPIKPTWLAFVLAFMLAMGVQSSGALVVMNFGPSLAKRMGMAPLTGFVVLMAWNMTAAGVAVLVRKSGYSAFNMMMMGLGVSFFATLTSALATAPWIFSNPDSDLAFMLMTVGLMGGLTAFRAFLLPSFSVLIQRMFSSEWRSLGTGAGTSFHYACTLLVVWSFPSAVELLSYSSDTRSGQSFVFTIFALLSCLCSIGTYTFLRNVA